MSENHDFSDFTVYLVGHAHIDLGYRWRWSETVHRVARDTFRGVLRMMDQVPEFTFVQSQLALYEAIKVHYPQLFSQILERIREGRWIVTDGWCEYDHTMPGGESMIRQHLIGSRYAREVLGCEIDMAWAPDAFSGHINTLPTILKGCGIDYLLYGRGVPNNTPYFWWQGPDGSRVLAYSPAYGYSASLGPRILKVLDMWREMTGDQSMLFLYGRGDHGGGPREGDFQALEEMTNQPGMPKFVHATPQFFFEQVLASKSDLTTYTGELGGGFTGSCSSVGQAKQRNRQMEHLLLTAERFATIAMFLQRKPAYPRVDFEQAWRAVLHHQFHDELPGTSVGLVYDDNEADYQRIECQVLAILDSSLADIAARLDTRGEGEPLVVFNPLAWNHTASVRVTLRLNAQPVHLAIKDTDGWPMPTQIVALCQQGPYWLTEVEFVARDVPPLGYRVFRAETKLLSSSLTTAKELSILARDMSNSNVSKMGDGVIQLHRHLVVDVAKKYIGRGLPFSDLIQHGEAGLFQAVNKFDPAKGYDFESYAIWWIQRAIERVLSDQVHTIQMPKIPSHVDDMPINKTEQAIVLETTLLRATIDQKTGHLVSVWDKRANRETLSGPSNVLQAIAEIPHKGTAWIIALSDTMDELNTPESVEIVASGPVRSTVRITYRYRDSYFVQEVSLLTGAPYVDMRLHAHWYERDTCLKVAFAADVEQGEATFEAPLGTVVRPADGAEVPAQRWIDLSNVEHGVSLLNDCRYAFDIDSSCLRMTLLRGFPDMFPEADVGEHDLHYAFLPHAGDWRAGDVVRQGWAYNMPMIPRQTLRRAGVIAPWIGPGINHAMPSEFGFLAVEPDNVVLIAFKLEQEDWGPGSPVVIRLYETAGLPTKVKIVFAAPLMMCEETNHLEERIESDAVSFDEEIVTVRFRAHEIKTLRFRLIIPAFAIYAGIEHRNDLPPGALPGFGDG